MHDLAHYQQGGCMLGGLRQLRVGMAGLLGLAGGSTTDSKDPGSWVDTFTFTNTSYSKETNDGRLP